MGRFSSPDFSGVAGLFVASAKPNAAKAHAPAFGLDADAAGEPGAVAEAVLSFRRSEDPIGTGEETESFAKGGTMGSGDGNGSGKKGGGTGGGSTDGGSTDGGGTTYTGAYVSGLDTPGGFNIDIVLVGDWPETLLGSLVRAAERLSDLITGDLPSYSGIDDIRLTASLAAIDGGGGVVGSGGAGSLRTGSYLPATGFLRFDTADATNLFGKGMFDSLVLHEMIHALGFGKNVWGKLGLVTSYDGDLRFTGDNATEAYAVEFPALAAVDPLAVVGVPVETDGGSGTVGSHWDEAAFRGELMTGVLNGSNFLSGMSVAALEDMGYQTVYGDALVFTA